MEQRKISIFIMVIGLGGLGGLGGLFCVKNLYVLNNSPETSIKPAALNSIPGGNSSGEKSTTQAHQEPGLQAGSLSSPTQPQKDRSPAALPALSESQMVSLLSLFESYRNAFVDKSDEIEALFRNDPELPSKVFSFLKHPPRPKWVKHRMSAIDVLEVLASSEAYSEQIHLQAQGALMGVVAFEIPKHFSSEQKRILAAEKYDALGALARITPDRAIQVYRTIQNPRLKRLLKAGLFNALVDQGWAPERIENLL